MKWQKDNRVALDNDGTRVDAVDKVTGRARYTTDHYLPKMLWAGYVRCPHGSATVKSVDLDAAKKVKGVLEVELTKKEGTYAGDRLGHVCAESPAALEEGLAALKVEFAIGRPKTVLDDEKTPLAQIKPSDNAEAAAKALQGADIVHEATYVTQVQTHCCQEPHIVVVDYRGDSARAWASTQGTFSVRDQLVRPLGLKQDQVEMHCEHVGGGFGSKFGMGAEGELAARMSKKYGRPCRVGLDRKEEQLDAGNRPGSMQYMKIGLDKDGKMKGGRIHSWGLVGPRGGGGGVQNPSRYDFGEIDKTHEDVHLNAGFPRAMRAPGHPQGIYAVEMMLDELAARVGMDPVEFRMKNESSDTRREMLQVGADLIGWNRRRPDGTWPGTVKHGFGVGAADWGNSSGNATIQVDVHRDGAVEVLSGSQDIGTGFRTVLTDCVASQLGVSRDKITAKVGVSTYPPGPASGGSVTSRFTAPKAFGAAEQAREAVLKLVAKEWNVEPARLTLQDNVISDGTRKMPWEKACRLITSDRLTFSESENGEFWKEPTGSEGVQFFEVAVDTETGIVRVVKVVAIQSCGLPVNRNTVENQITGGVIQGISFALFEDRILNGLTGAMVNPNMEMYKIAGTQDVPEIVPVIWRARPDVGVNSLGEPPVIPPPGAIGCAVANAIGVRIRSIPITPAKVLAALESGKGGRA
jgi:xanthine dehydrogenase YagR molybdenum-binding subunit